MSSFNNHYGNHLAIRSQHWIEKKGLSSDAVEIICRSELKVVNWSVYNIRRNDVEQ